MMVVESWGNQGWGVYVRNGNNLEPSNARPEGYLIPGFVDLHIHGAFNIDFMSATAEDLIKLADQLEHKGYESFLPTTVTASFEDVQKAINNLPDDPRMPGFHLEGPFISPDYPGAQPPEAILDIPNEDSPWQGILDHPKLKTITVAPEKPNALPLIEKLNQRGVKVSLGHTAATFAEATQGIDHGVTRATHAYNAMRGLHHREAGTLGAVLTDDRIAAELIYDRHHVSRPAAELLFKAKLLDKVIAVSDCTKAYGQPAGTQIEMWGHQCTVGESDVRLSGTNTLAGSASTLLECFQNLAEDFNPQTATRLCSINPRQHIGVNGVKTYVLFSRQLEIKDILTG